MYTTKQKMKFVISSSPLVWGLVFFTQNISVPMSLFVTIFIVLSASLIVIHIPQWNLDDEQLIGDTFVIPNLGPFLFVPSKGVRGLKLSYAPKGFDNKVALVDMELIGKVLDIDVVETMNYMAIRAGLVNEEWSEIIDHIACDISSQVFKSAGVYEEEEFKDVEKKEDLHVSTFPYCLRIHNGLVYAMKINK